MFHVSNKFFGAFKCILIAGEGERSLTNSKAENYPLKCDYSFHKP